MGPGFVPSGMRDFLVKTRGCIVEMAMEGTHTRNRQPQRTADSVRIAKDEAEAIAA